VYCVYNEFYRRTFENNLPFLLSTFKIYIFYHWVLQLFGVRHEYISSLVINCFIIFTKTVGIYILYKNKIFSSILSLKKLPDLPPIGTHTVLNINYSYMRIGDTATDNMLYVYIAGLTKYVYVHSIH
jgi:hypothetical protein